ncbi:MAG TPA: hypothetical protein VFN67_09365 [Polyangiales bacterium]|nr:hypothetical protein [Polyangiales bacterium]
MEDYTASNREYWTGVNSQYTDPEAEKDWVQRFPFEELRSARKLPA